MQPTNQPVSKFLDSIEDPQRRQDGQRLVKLMQDATGQAPVMWGTSIVGFGSLHYKYESGREGDTVVVGFSPRKQALVIYGVLTSDEDGHLAEKLGKFTTGKGCMYIKHLADVDEAVLARMVSAAYQRKSAPSN